MAPRALVETVLGQEKQKVGLSVARAGGGITMGAVALCGAVMVPMCNKRILVGSAPCAGRAAMPQRGPMETTKLTCLRATLHNGT